MKKITYASVFLLSFFIALQQFSLVSNAEESVKSTSTVGISFIEEETSNISNRFPNTGTSTKITLGISGGATLLTVLTLALLRKKKRKDDYDEKT